MVIGIEKALDGNCRKRAKAAKEKENGKTKKRKRETAKSESVIPVPPKKIYLAVREEVSVITRLVNSDFADNHNQSCLRAQKEAEEEVYVSDTELLGELKPPSPGYVGENAKDFSPFMKMFHSWEEFLKQNPH